LATVALGSRATFEANLTVKALAAAAGPYCQRAEQARRASVQATTKICRRWRSSDCGYNPMAVLFSLRYGRVVTQAWNSKSSKDRLVIHARQQLLLGPVSRRSDVRGALIVTLESQQIAFAHATTCK